MQFGLRKSVLYLLIGVRLLGVGLALYFILEFLFSGSGTDVEPYNYTVFSLPWDHRVLLLSFGLFLVPYSLVESKFCHLSAVAVLVVGSLVLVTVFFNEFIKTLSWRQSDETWVVAGLTLCICAVQPVAVIGFRYYHPEGTFYDTLKISFRVFVPPSLGLLLLASGLVVMNGQVFTQNLFWVISVTVCLIFLVAHALLNRRTTWIMIIDLILACWAIGIIKSKALNLPQDYEFQTRFNESHQQKTYDNAAEQPASGNPDKPGA